MIKNGEERRKNYFAKLSLVTKVSNSPPRAYRKVAKSIAHQIERFLYLHYIGTTLETTSEPTWLHTRYY